MILGCIWYLIVERAVVNTEIKINLHGNSLMESAFRPDAFSDLSGTAAKILA